MMVKDLLSTFVDKDYVTIRIIENIPQTGLSVLCTSDDLFGNIENYDNRQVSLWTSRENRLDIIIKSSS